MAGGVTLYTSVLTVQALTVAARTNGTAVGPTVDVRQTGKGFTAALLIVQTGVVTDGTHTVEVQHSDDGATGWTAVPDEQLQGAEPVVGAADDLAVFEVGLTPAKRFVRVSVVTAAATTGGVLGAVLVLGQPRRMPVR